MVVSPPSLCSRGGVEGAWSSLEGALVCLLQDWFRSATEELQAQLLTDWGAAESSQAELISERHAHAQAMGYHVPSIRSLKYQV